MNTIDNLSSDVAAAIADTRYFDDKDSPDATNQVAQIVAKIIRHSIEELEQLRANANKVVCVFCGNVEDRRADGWITRTTNHIMTCEKSPLVNLIKMAQEAGGAMETGLKQFADPDNWEVSERAQGWIFKSTEEPWRLAEASMEIAFKFLHDPTPPQPEAASQSPDAGRGTPETTPGDAAESQPGSASSPS